MLTIRDFSDKYKTAVCNTRERLFMAVEGLYGLLLLLGLLYSALHCDLRIAMTCDKFHQHAGSLATVLKVACDLFLFGKCLLVCVSPKFAPRVGSGAL